MRCRINIDILLISKFNILNKILTVYMIDKRMSSSNIHSAKLLELYGIIIKKNNANIDYLHFGQKSNEYG